MIDPARQKGVMLPEKVQKNRGTDTRRGLGGKIAKRQETEKALITPNTKKILYRNKDRRRVIIHPDKTKKRQTR